MTPNEIAFNIAFELGDVSTSVLSDAIASAITAERERANAAIEALDKIDAAAACAEDTKVGTLSAAWVRGITLPAFFRARGAKP
jgi:hypothetical protein